MKIKILFGVLIVLMVGELAFFLVNDFVIHRPFAEKAVVVKETTAPIVEAPEIIPPSEKTPAEENPISPVAAPIVEIVQAPGGHDKPQFVVLSFDGSQAIPMWEATRKFARDLNASGTPIHFTYFVSSVYWLAPAFKNIYESPGEKPGASRIGFAYSVKDVDNRIKEVNAAIAEGHEIGSHLNGHFDGTNWTAADWEQEFNSFNNLLFNYAANNQIDPAKPLTKLNLTEADVVGLRAPNLATNANLAPVLQKFNYRYDASKVKKNGIWPTKENGIWQLGLSSIKVADKPNYLLAMDYNFYLYQTKTVDLVKKAMPEWQTLHNEVLNTYLNYFNLNYNGTRAPIVIGHHFSLWNDGVYWEAMKDFARAVCGRPEVQCVNFRKLADWLDAQP
jgi:hypothetical protein